MLRINLARIHPAFALRYDGAAAKGAAFNKKGRQAMLKRLLAVGALIMVVLASGCASVPMASVEQDTAAKSFATKPGKANIYVYRKESMGAAIKMPVALNGKLVGDTAAKTYLVLEVPPGQHTITSKTENDSAVAVNAVAAAITSFGRRSRWA